MKKTITINTLLIISILGCLLFSYRQVSLAAPDERPPDSIDAARESIITADWDRGDHSIKKITSTGEVIYCWDYATPW